MAKESVYSSLGESKKSFMSWQLRTILVTMVGYALFYFVRKNFSLAMPGLTAAGAAAAAALDEHRADGRR